MKKITSIKIKNFRAFYGEYLPILLRNGQNLLVYGENGSGKTSLARAIDLFFRSSRNPKCEFITNTYASEDDDGKIEIEFMDYDKVAQTITPNSGVSYCYAKINSTHGELFIKNAELVKGVLSYRDILSVYLTTNANSSPNLFDLFVRSILKSHRLLPQRGTITQEWEKIEAGLESKGSTREGIIARQNITLFFEILVNYIQTNIIEKQNQLLSKYFNNGLVIKLDSNLTQNDNKYSAYLTLNIEINGKPIADPSEYLNEAKLSALSICLFLAALKTNPADFELKLLILDDVFIGLDTSNRNPLLEIIKNEFDDYQVFIFTHDRYWYELTKRHFDRCEKDNWAFYEMYIGSKKVNNVEIDTPILITGVSDLDKAIKHLHNPIEPDFPAAANYFRKHLEEFIKDVIPPDELREDPELIEVYKLHKRIERAKAFIKKILGDDRLLTELQGFIDAIMNPFSHYNISESIHRKELLELSDLIPKIENYLIKIKNECKPILFKSYHIFIKFDIRTEEGLVKESFQMVLETQIYSIKDSNGQKTLSLGGCTLVIKKKKTETKYDSIKEAYDACLQEVKSKHDASPIQLKSDWLESCSTFINKNELSLRELIEKAWQ